MCSIEDCHLENFSENDKCILHCEKNKWEDESKINDFWNEICETIDKVNRQNISSGKIIREVEEESNSKILKYRFSNIIFPAFRKKYNAMQERDFFGLKKNINLEFDSCIFMSNVDFSLIGSSNNISFKFCTFDSDVIFKESKFNGLFLLESCTFNKNLRFQNILFLDTASFINTKVKRKADFIHIKFQSLALFEAFKSNDFVLDNTFFKDEVSFLSVEVNNLDRKTARIIKNSFEQQNNIIEANKFYALEMKEREKEISPFKNLLEWLTFKIHGLASNHSQNWFLALFWIINLTFLTNFLSYEFSCENSTLHILDRSLFFIGGLIVFVYGISKLKEKFINISLFVFSIFTYLIYINSYINDTNLNEFSNMINPFSIMTKGAELTFEILVYKIIIAYLIYQLIISIRQNTRRK